MFEQPDFDVGLTHDDARQALIAASEQEPVVIGNVNLDEKASVAGWDLGYALSPGDGWVRLWWAELAQRLGLDFSEHRWPPSFRWFPWKWPAAIQPPCEGSLDELNLKALIPHLIAESASDDCVACYGKLAIGYDTDAERCWRGPVVGIEDLVDGGRCGTPTNVWSPDRRWFLYTSWDLWATKVSGPPSLIERLVADPQIETLRWTRPVD